MITHLRCAGYAVAGVLLGGCVQAWAQAVPGPVVDPSAPPGWVMQLLQIGGLPAAVGVLGWLMGKGGIRITVHLSPESIEALKTSKQG